MTAYIWQAMQTQPGKHGVTYRVTKTSDAPKTKEPVKHQDSLTGEDTGLVYDDSMYSDWELLGTVNGEAYETIYGEFCVKMETPAMYGHAVTIEEIVEAGWYSKAA